ncbi:MAG: large conductance mechanosensitive channel protein MscL [Clostridia bacterium]|nr:large conductance mechanosensitive channel protein MscL [Clostridia bacterium]
MWEKFKKFAFKGNVVDMAVGVVVGGAFGKIVTSLVNDLITPLISLATGGANFSELFVILNANGADTAAIKTIEAAKEAGFATLNYGNFIQTVIDFFIIALSIFMFVSLIQKARDISEAKKKAEEEVANAAAPAEPPKPTAEELLAEIRDLLKKD